MASSAAISSFSISFLRLLGLLGGGEDAANAGAVGGHGLFHENVLPLADGLLEVEGTEARGRGKDDDVGEGDRLLESVEPDELAVGRDVHLGALGLLEVVEGAFEAVLEGVGHGDELGSRHAQGLVGGPGAAAAAAHERDLQGVAGLRKGESIRHEPGGRHRAQRRARG